MRFNIENQNWIIEVAKSSNLKLVGEYTEIKATDMSLVQKILTDKGNLFFKKTSDSSVFEAKLSEYLYSQFPERTVKVLAVHDSKPWLMLRELSGKPLRQIRDKKVWKHCLQEYAELQIKAVEHVNTFIDLGVPNRRMDVLKEEIKTHLKDMCLTGLTEEETKQILSIESELIGMCDEMVGSIPYSIDHGDLHSGNIQYVNNQPVFFDWGDSAVTRPFFSTRIFWNTLYDLLDEETDNQWREAVNEFRPYYLEPWTKYAKMDELEKLLSISDQLACVYRAIGWHVYINPFRVNFEDSRQKPSLWLKELLEFRKNS